MQTLTEKLFHFDSKSGIFDDTVLSYIFPNLSIGALRALLHRAVKKGEVIRLKPGYYCLSAKYQSQQLHPFLIAAVLHSPSHISLESALSHHGLIPEFVHQVTSVTTQRSRVMDSPLGVFSYQRVPTHFPLAGIKSFLLDTSWLFMATPLRAIADLVYLRREVTWRGSGMEFLTISLRMEEHKLRKLDLSCFSDIYESFKNQRTRTFLKEISKELGHV